VRVVGVGLAALPDVEHPGPGGQLRRHVQHPLAVGEQSLRVSPSEPSCPGQGRAGFKSVTDASNS
jgi:hypothetical protein